MYLLEFYLLLDYLGFAEFYNKFFLTPCEQSFLEAVKTVQLKKGLIDPI